MTEISFHFNVADRSGYACRLLRKASRQRRSIAVTGPRELLAELDRALWSFDAAEFVAHSWTEAAAAVPARLQAGTVWLAPVPLEAPRHDALVNLGRLVPAGFESFERLIEVVSTDEGDRAAARERWKGYARRGYAITRHEVAP